MAVELGLVKFFSVEKRFGFLVIPGAPKLPADVFFHAENGRRIALQAGEMHLLRNPERVPKYRDAVVFERALTIQGPVALWWAYAEEYALVLAQLFG